MVFIVFIRWCVFCLGSDLLVSNGLCSLRDHTVCLSLKELKKISGACRIKVLATFECISYQIRDIWTMYSFPFDTNFPRFVPWNHPRMIVQSFKDGFGSRSYFLVLNPKPWSHPFPFILLKTLSQCTPVSGVATASSSSVIACGSATSSSAFLMTMNKSCRLAFPSLTLSTSMLFPSAISNSLCSSIVVSCSAFTLASSLLFTVIVYHYRPPLVLVKCYCWSFMSFLTIGDVSCLF